MGFLRTISFLLILSIGPAVLVGCGGLKLDHAVRSSPDDWPMFARTETRSNVAIQSILPPLSLQWEYDVTGGIGNGSPLIVDTLVIVGNLRGELYVISANNGNRLGWVSLGDAIQGSPVVDGSVAFVATSNSRESLVAFDLSEGSFRWKREYGDLEVSPLLFEQRLYFGNTSGTFYCVERDKGELLWKFELPGNEKRKGIRSSAAAVEKTVVFGAEDGSVYALDAETGKQRWRYRTSAPVVAAPAVMDSVVYVATLGGLLHAIELSSGKPKWEFAAGSPLYASPSFAPGTVVLGTTGGKLIALNAGDGSNTWTTNLDGVINSSAVVSGNIAYVGTLKKELFAVNVSTGSIVWKQSVEGRIKTTPAVARNRVVVATDERLILSFKGEEQ
ncbi:MAG: PQQ-binding-like beta-propeller repeat protein [Ignavibacteriae bacterium]|nr:PQQ-binding-like beta-propeller repeat protein [Ignavibacteriota bacterium]